MNLWKFTYRPNSAALEVFTARAHTIDGVEIDQIHRPSLPGPERSPSGDLARLKGVESIAVLSPNVRTDYTDLQKYSKRAAMS
ncbi:uncharacterized protein N7503_004159 [Penicillium pulvis]|uniref:uncharacterized protein n=1 Tax=Penicillium pulvis TaxID=1562058 RepID=UPI002548CF37|nr:uncharacterized protein N7503_004159 [Penicillium pulvis]KAJ5806557.1 hypothetical protein N7503_004159 [Penicillium pulvis]